MLRCLSVYRHAVVNTPVARWALIARGTAYSNRFPVPSGGGLPHHCARSATTLDFSRPAQRSLAVTACRLAEPPIATRLSRRLRRFRFLHRRSDSYRLERPSCRVGVTPTEDQHLTRFTAHAVDVLTAHCPVVNRAATFSSKEIAQHVGQLRTPSRFYRLPCMCLQLKNQKQRQTP